MAAEAPRRRPRRGSLERPVSTRIYRAAWLVVAVPVLVAAFSVGRPDPLPAPRTQPFFDQETALQFATELTTFPNRAPGTEGQELSTDWVEDQLQIYGFTVERQTFSADIPGLGTEELVNLVAVAPRTGPAATEAQRPIVVLAHRDNIGTSPGADDNASGTGALLELARDLGSASHAHPIVLVSTDGGAYGGVGAAHFARSLRYQDRPAALVNLDAIAARGPPRIEFAGDTARVPSPTLLATVDEMIEAQSGRRARPGRRLRSARGPRVPLQLLRASAVRLAWRAGGHRHHRRQPPTPFRRRLHRQPRRATPRRARPRHAIDRRVTGRVRRCRKRYAVLPVLRYAPPLRLDPPAPAHRRAHSLPGRNGRSLRALPPPSHRAPARASQLSQPTGHLALAGPRLRALRGARPAAKRREPTNRA